MVTLPLEHVRGRYTLSMYTQMNHLDLVADNISHYSQLVVHLLANKTYRNLQSEMIETKFYHSIHRNNLVASEWMNFFVTASKQLLL